MAAFDESVVDLSAAVALCAGLARRDARAVLDLPADGLQPCERGLLEPAAARTLHLKTMKESIEEAT